MFELEKRKARAQRKGPQMSAIEVGALLCIITKNLNYTWAGKLLSLYVGGRPDLMDGQYRYPEECWPELARHFGAKSTEIFWGAVVTSAVFEVDIDNNNKRYFYSPVIRRYHEVMDNALVQYLSNEADTGRKDNSAEKPAENSASKPQHRTLSIMEIPKFPSCAGASTKDMDKESPIPISGVIQHTGDPSADIQKALDGLRMSYWVGPRLEQEFNVAPEYVLSALDYLIRQPLTSHILRAKNKDGKGLKFESFVRWDYFQAWVSNILNTSCGKGYLEESAKHANDEKDRNAHSLIRPDIINNRPVSPYEWQDPSTSQRYYQDPNNGIVCIPPDAPPRPSDDVSWHVNKQVWYKRNF